MDLFAVLNSPEKDLRLSRLRKERKFHSNNPSISNLQSQIFIFSMARMLLKSNMLDGFSLQKESSIMSQPLANLCGLLFILLGSFWGIAVGSWLYGGLGGILGLTIGSLWGYHVAEGFSSLLRTQRINKNDVMPVTVLTQSENPPLSSSKRSWISKVLGRKPVKPSFPESYSLEEIHRRLRAINAQIWLELRQGVLSSCHAGLHSVRLEERGEPLDWREINRRTVAALHRFEISMNDDERRASLNEALDSLGQKLLLVQKAAMRKADRLNPEEEQEIQKNEAELWRLSRFARTPPSQN